MSKPHDPSVPTGRPRSDVAARRIPRGSSLRVLNGEGPCAAGPIDRAVLELVGTDDRVIRVVGPAIEEFHDVLSPSHTPALRGDTLPPNRRPPYDPHLDGEPA